MIHLTSRQSSFKISRQKKIAWLDNRNFSTKNKTKKTKNFYFLFSFCMHFLTKVFQKIKTIFFVVVACISKYKLFGQQKKWYIPFYITFFSPNFLTISRKAVPNYFNKCISLKRKKILNEFRNTNNTVYKIQFFCIYLFI